MKTYFIEFSYLLASILFILGLRGLSHPETARRGMHLAEFGMVTAVIGTLLQREIISYEPFHFLLAIWADNIFPTRL